MVEIIQGRVDGWEEVPDESSLSVRTDFKELLTATELERKIAEIFFGNLLVQRQCFVIEAMHYLNTSSRKQLRTLSVGQDRYSVGVNQSLVFAHTEKP